MKKVFSALYRLAPTVLSALVLNPFAASAQTNFSFPVVTIKATDPVALESGKPATFTVFRAGPTNASLVVYYNINGTASNGVNYTNISHFLSVPAGATSATITIQPIPDTSAGDKEEGTLSVVLQLAPSPLMTPVNFTIGIPNTATAYIFDDDSGSNLPPVVSMIAPPDGSVFYNPTSISLIATAFDPDGTVSNVEFYANGTDLGRGLMVIMDPPGVNGVTGPVYFFNWTNPQIGKYALTAVATDNGGLSTTSAPVNIRVLPPPPVVKITSPTNGAMFIAPVNIPVSATAVSSNEDVVRVDFFADNHFIGADIGINQGTYSIIWSNAIPGFYDLRAVATDSLGGQGFSPPVFISVIGTVPPPTNTPVVTIYARDPIAVVGTNCLGCYTNPAATALNCLTVTNTATFVVRRAGPTNMDLTVYYSIGGTASNGVDYVTLPGTVTIPAGKFAAPIVVVPLDEGVPECPETVVLALQEPTNVPPPYVVGWPGKAAAIIVDCDFVPPVTSVLCVGDFHFSCFPPPSSTAYYRLDCSVDLTHWLPICTNTASEIGIHFTDPDTGSSPNRFYRVVPQTSAPLVGW